LDFCRVWSEDISNLVGVSCSNYWPERGISNPMEFVIAYQSTAIDRDACQWTVTAVERDTTSVLISLLSMHSDLVDRDRRNLSNITVAVIQEKVESLVARAGAEECKLSVHDFYQKAINNLQMPNCVLLQQVKN
jgi:hypothetical protein